MIRKTRQLTSRPGSMLAGPLMEVVQAKMTYWPRIPPVTRSVATNPTRHRPSWTGTSKPWPFLPDKG
jgi:hypothetical protein